MLAHSPQLFKSSQFYEFESEPFIRNLSRKYGSKHIHTHRICDRDELKNQIGYAHRGAYTKLSLIIRMDRNQGSATLSVCNDVFDH